MSDQKPAKLPGLPAVSTGNVSLDRWIQSATERFEVREGARGSDLERVVTQRDLNTANFIRGSGSNGGAGSRRSGGVLVQGSDGSYTSMTVDAFGDEIRKTRLYQHLMTRLDDPARFDDLPEKVRALLLVDLANEAAQRGAAITEVDYKYQSATESLAYQVETVTAAVADAQAGIRQTAFASATKDNATAGLITQIVASLDGTGSASLEESLVVIADRTAGLSSQFMLKLNAGGAVAGIGLMASEDPTGATESSFIVQADKFSVVMPGLTGAIPFGVDASGVYINGNLRINAGGPTIAEGIEGPPGTDGDPGKRGTRQLYDTNALYVSGYGFAAQATILIAAATSGSTPTTPIKGDTVTFTNGSTYTYTLTCTSDGSNWAAPGVVIDGSLLVTGSVLATKIAAGLLDGFTLRAGTGSTPNSRAFEVNASGAVWADNLVSQLLLVSSASSTNSTPGQAGAYPCITASSANTAEAILGRVSGTNESTTAHGVRGQNLYSNALGRITTAGLLGAANGYDVYGEGNGVNYGPFTGAHDALVPKGYSLTHGDILVDIGVAARRNTSNTISYVGLSTAPNQKGVIGVVATDARSMTEDSAPSALKLDMVMVKDGYGDDVLEHNACPAFAGIAATHNVLAMNALGEGQVNVCGENGNLSIGDLIVSSSLPGKGMRQSDDLVRSYTVAKCRENVTFSSSTEVKMVACIYLCG